METFSSESDELSEFPASNPNLLWGFHLSQATCGRLDLLLLLGPFALLQPTSITWLVPKKIISQLEVCLPLGLLLESLDCVIPLRVGLLCLVFGTKVEPPSVVVILRGEEVDWADLFRSTKSMPLVSMSCEFGKFSMC